MLFTKKKVTIVILSILFLVLSLGIGGSQNFDLPDDTVYTFSYYGPVLNEMFSEIQKVAMSYNLDLTSKQKGQIFAKRLGDVIDKYKESGKIKFAPQDGYSIGVMVSPIPNTKTAMYYVNIILPLHEWDPVGKLPSVLYISKNIFCGIGSLKSASQV